MAKKDPTKKQITTPAAETASAEQPKRAAETAADEEIGEAGLPPMLERLLARGKEQGFVNEQDILAAVPDPEDHIDEIDDVFSALYGMGIKSYRQIEEEAASDGKTLEAEEEESGPVVAEPLLSLTEPDEGALAEIEEETVEVTPEIDDNEIVDDSVRMYLREIGRVPLLTWHGEKELAIQMEDGKLLEDISDLLGAPPGP